jgi:hypothetical protein
VPPLQICLGDEVAAAIILQMHPLQTSLGNEVGCRYYPAGAPLQICLGDDFHKVKKWN